MAIHTQTRQQTPPGAGDLLTPQSAGSNRSSRGFSTYGTSPSSSVKTNITTPPRSPASHQGREILPRVRKQDQLLDSPVPAFQHQKPHSITSTGFPMGYDPRITLSNSHRRSDSPAEMNMVTPVSASSHMDDCAHWGRLSPPPNSLDLPLPHISHSRSVSASSLPAESRSNSHCTINTQLLNRYAYPTYRQTPVYTSSAASGPSAPGYAPIGQEVSSNLFVIPQPHMVGQPSYAQPLSPELDFESYPEATPATTLRDYLTLPNPSPSLIRRNPSPNRLHDTHFWWDIRNILPWADFNLETIQAIPGLRNLLELDIPQPALPTPGRSNTQPDTLSALHDIHTEYYVVKVNAALKASLGNSHLAMHPAKSSSQPGAVTVPDFLASYAHESEVTPSGDHPRGRVVGLVRSFEQWNSGMRSESANSKISFLRELAHLHRYMREHSCRYGFIITEIELVCVRMGRSPGAPIYGLLELATPVQLHTAGRDSLTAPLALWYLHMLATNSPLPGQCGWKVDVGGAAALTRRHVADRDGWINLKPEGREKRDAKRNRGWVFPEEPLSRRECGRPRRWTKKMERERREGYKIAY